MGSWPVKDAGDRFGELVHEANASGAQMITHEGRERAVVLSIAGYQRLTEKKMELTGKKMDFVQFLLSIPKDDDFPVERDRDEGRFIEL